MTKSWTEILEVASEYAKCTPRQASAAWQAGAKAFHGSESIFLKWSITGMGTLKWKSTTQVPITTSTVTGGFKTYTVRSVLCTGYYTPNLDDEINYASSPLYETFNNWPVDVFGGWITPYENHLRIEGKVVPAFYYRWSEEYPGQVFPDLPKTPKGGPYKLRLQGHKGVRIRHRDGEI